MNRCLFNLWTDNTLLSNGRFEPAKSYSIGLQNFLVILKQTIKKIFMKCSIVTLQPHSF